tara:strand:- start:12548 stop:12859 length:312 start_codon:yes stop_codon:yes gene_type:complete
MHKFKRYVILLFLLIISGCAISYVDVKGQKRIIGLVNLTLSDKADDQGADKVEVTSIGLLVSSNPVSTGLSVGYTKEVTMKINDNALILMDDIRKDREDEPTN